MPSSWSARRLLPVPTSSLPICFLSILLCFSKGGRDAQEINRILQHRPFVQRKQGKPSRISVFAKFRLSNRWKTLTQGRGTGCLRGACADGLHHRIPHSLSVDLSLMILHIDSTQNFEDSIFPTCEKHSNQ